MSDSIKIDGITVGVEIKPDGVYLAVDRPPGNTNPLDFGSLRALIDNHGIDDWDFNAVLEIVENMSPKIYTLISNNTTLKVVHESARVRISPDKMLAEIIFSPPVNDDRTMTAGEIRDVLTQNRIVAGIDEEMIEKLVEHKEYESYYVIAAGKNVENGENGSIEFLFNTGKASYKPKELETGKLDYYNLDLFQVAHKGKELAIISPPKDGSDGFNVIGEMKKAVPGKAAISPVGKNTRLSEDGLTVTSEIDGQIVYTNGKIAVNPVLEIKGNVDTTTGNIGFLGTVTVHGNVLTGFSINATGNIEVHGVVEGATISCDGNLYIKGGVQGVGKAILTSKGSITAKFIENATVVADNDIVSDSVLRCNIKCGGSLLLAGKRGQLIGGSTKVLHTISANIIGSHMEASTEIQAGLDPDLFDEYTRKRAELARLKKELSQLSQIIETLAVARDEGKLTEPKKAILIKSLQSKTYIKSKLTELYADIERLIPELTKGAGVVRVQKLVNPGVKITIGNAILYVKDKLEQCSLSNVDGEIKMDAL